jgi:hypothetical protein
VVVAFRRDSLLSLDDCLYALQPTIPHLIRSSLHRCLKRHGISRLPQVEGEASPKRQFKAYPIGYFHIDIAKFGPLRASSISSSRSIGRRSSPSSNYTRRSRAAPPGFPAPPDRRRPLQGPHRPHRQRNPLHHARQYELGSPDIKAAPDAGEPLWGESLEKMAAHVDAPQPFELAVVPGDRLGEGAVNPIR